MAIDMYTLENFAERHYEDLRKTIPQSFSNKKYDFITEAAIKAGYVSAQDHPDPQESWRLELTGNNHGTHILVKAGKPLKFFTLLPEDRPQEPRRLAVGGTAENARDLQQMIDFLSPEVENLITLLHDKAYTPTHQLASTAGYILIGLSAYYLSQSPAIAAASVMAANASGLVRKASKIAVSHGKRNELAWKGLCCGDDALKNLAWEAAMEEGRKDFLDEIKRHQNQAHAHSYHSTRSTL